MSALWRKKVYSMKIAIARPFNIIGAGMPEGLLMGDLIRKIKEAVNNKTNTIKVGGLESVRDFMYIDDVIPAYVEIINQNKWGDVFNICTGIYYSVGELIPFMTSLFDPKIEVESIPNNNGTEQISVSYGDNRKAKQEIGFRVKTKLSVAIKKIYDIEFKEV